MKITLLNIDTISVDVLAYSSETPRDLSQSKYVLFVSITRIFGTTMNKYQLTS